MNGSFGLAVAEVATGAERTAWDPMAVDSAELVRVFAAVAGGDLDALAAVYDACAGDLFALALWRTGSRDDAADAVQEVFVRLAQRASGLGRVREPRAYLLAMAHSAAVDILRRRRKTVDVSDALVEAVTADPANTADASRLSGLLRALPAAQREAVWLRHFGELSFAQVGQVTGVPTFTAASRYRLGIRRLRKLLGVRP